MMMMIAGAARPSVAHTPPRMAVGSYFLPISPVIFVLIAALAGIALKAMGGKKKC